MLQKRFVKMSAIAALVLLVLTGAAALYGVSLFTRSLPDYAGQAVLPGLGSDVQIYRDRYGVPHIFAANMNDAAKALGYVHASERLFQMEMQRRAGQGRLSEVIGPDMLGVDKFIRTLGLYGLAESSAASMSPEAQKFFEDYAAGVNAWLETHQDKLPPEFSLLHIKPEPWKVADSIVWGKLMALQLSHNYKLELLRGELAAHLTPQQMAAIFPLAPGSAPVTTGPHTMQKTENTIPHDDAYAQLGKITGLDHGASNEWVIAGSRTESGKPILANDPHLGLEAPILWYLARIVTPNQSIKGATVPGLPIFLLGQNDSLAWGFTTTGSDVQDLFIETIDPKNPDHYLTPKSIDGGSESFIIRNEIIKIKGKADVMLNIRSTRHGPVMSDIDEEMAGLAGSGKVMALAFTGLGEHDRTSEALMHLNRATNASDLLEALKLYQAPPQNVVYADSKGAIGFINPGLVPVRKRGDGLTPADGASGDYDWVGTIPFTQLPQIANPQAGFVFNANNAVAFIGGLYFMGVDWEEPYRAERLQEYFDTLLKHSLDTSAAMQADHVSLVAKQLLPYLLNVKPNNARAEQAQNLLRNWDGVMDKNRSEPLIFDAWLYQMRQKILADKAGSDLKERGPYMATSIATVLGNHLTEWCGGGLDKPASNCDAVIADALDAALDQLNHRESGSMEKWRWGNEHITLLKHKVYSHVPILKWISDLSVKSSGDFYTLDRGGSFTHDADYPYARTHGGGYRGIYDLGDPAKSRFMITTGESGNIFSKHYGDLVPLWNDVKAITLSGTEDELKAQGLPELVLQKAP